MILVSFLYYATILGITTQPFQAPSYETKTISLDVETYYYRKEGFFRTGKDAWGDAYLISFSGLGSLLDNWNLINNLGPATNPMSIFYLKINGKITEIGRNEGIQDCGFRSYWSLSNTTFTFLTDKGNVTLQTPIEAYINFTYTS